VYFAEVLESRVNFAANLQRTEAALPGGFLLRFGRDRAQAIDFQGFVLHIGS
jgi:hypothetical protein